MIEIGFSVMENNPGDVEQLRPLLNLFEKQHHIKVNPIGITWAQGWGEIAKLGIYGHGPDVSSIGTTWIGSLASMQTLRSFTPAEIRALGGAESFFEASWRAGFLANDPNLWAVPWIGDVMLLYYWEKALQKTGLYDAKTAFSTDAALVETLEHLQKNGFEYPLVLNIGDNTLILHEAAHWVWSAGGDFISPDGKQVVFNQPLAIQGFRNYFKLKPYISPKLLGKTQTSDLFNTGKGVICFAGPWLGTSVKNPSWGSDTPSVIVSPGITFTGGSSFVIWKHTLHPEESFKLVHFLATQPVHPPTSAYHHQVPTRREAMNLALNDTDVSHRAYSQYLKSMERGKSFPTMRLWGAVEDKLRVGLGNIWAELFANPDQNLDECIHRNLDPLAHRLNRMLGS